MNSNLTITLPKEKKERLSRLALRYGLSLPEFSRRILEEITSEIPDGYHITIRQGCGLALKNQTFSLVW